MPSEGVIFEVVPQGLESALARIRSLSAFRRMGLLDEIGAEVESQTRRRIQEEKSYPGTGFPWLPWSANYAETRHEGHSLLQSEGYLLDSIQYRAGADDVEIGSNLVYAATHQFGRDGIPPREFLGLSAENMRDLDDVIEDFFRGLLPFEGGA